MNAPLFSQLEFLRAHVESVVTLPASIMVTSAKTNDGKSLTAHGLAERLADSGRRVVLLQIGMMDVSLPGQRDVEARLSFPIVRLPHEDDETPIATPALRAKIDELRATYDYTIIDSAPLLKSRVATLLAGMVEAIILTVRLGRAADGDDSSLVQSLGRADANVLGVVAASAEDISAFAARSVNQAPGEILTPSFSTVPDFAARDRTNVPVLQGWRR